MEGGFGGGPTKYHRLAFRMLFAPNWYNTPSKYQAPGTTRGLEDRAGTAEATTASGAKDEEPKDPLAFRQRAHIDQGRGFDEE